MLILFRLIYRVNIYQSKPQQANFKDSTNLYRDAKGPKLKDGGLKTAEFYSTSYYPQPVCVCACTGVSVEDIFKSWFSPSTVGSDDQTQVAEFVKQVILPSESSFWFETTEF